MIGYTGLKKIDCILQNLFFTAIFVLLYTIAGQTACFATTVTLQWGASSGATGYKVYYQADSSSQPFSGTGANQGDSPIDVHDQSEVTISGLDSSHAYYFAVTAYNDSAESSYSNVVSVPELESPTVSISNPANNATVNGVVSVTANASDNVGVSKVEFYVNGTLKYTDSSDPYVYSWDTSLLAEGNYIISAKAFDAAGNNSDPAEVSVNVLKDSTAPTVSVTSPASGVSVSGTVSVTVVAEDDIGVAKVELYENGSLLSATNVPPYIYNWNTLSLTNGAYNLSAKAYDTANNVGTSATISVMVNNPDNEAPFISLTSPANGSTISGTVSVAAAASDNIGISQVEFYINDILAATDCTYPYSYSWSTTSVPNGNYIVYAKAYDAANNVTTSSSLNLTISNPDTSAPTVYISSPAPNATVNGTITVNAVASDNVGVSGVNFYVDGVFKYSDTSSPYSFNWDTAASANGGHTIFAKAYDAAGNIGTSSAVTVNVNNPDITAPTVTIFSPTNGSTVNGTVTVTATANDNVGVSKVEFYVNNVLQSTDTASPYTFSWNTTSVANGSFTLSAKAFDAANNVGSSANVSVTVNNQDTTAPSVSIVYPTSGASVNGTVTVTTSANDNVGVSTVEFYVNNVLQATDTESPYSFNWDTTTVANASYNLSAKAYDATGNVGESAGVTVTVQNTYSAPTISIVSPIDGAIFDTSSNITLTASATSVGLATIARVDFYNGEVLIKSVTSDPYTYTWRKVPSGTYTIYAKVFASDGTSNVSAPITIYVLSSVSAVDFVSISPPSPSSVGTIVTFDTAASGGSEEYEYQFMVKIPVVGWVTTQDYSPGSSFSWNTAGLSAGNYFIQVCARNTGSSSSCEAWKSIKYSLK